MFKSLRPLIALTLCAGLAAMPASANDRGLAREFSWIGAWGNVFPETGIPTPQHWAKGDIRNAILNCGIGNTDYGLIRTYGIDLTGDGKEDLITDGHDYFMGGYNTMTCPFAMCSPTHGCAMTLYALKTVSRIYSMPIPSLPTQQQPSGSQQGSGGAPNQGGSQNQGGSSQGGFFRPMCPASAEENTSCRSDCEATVQQCPHLFKFVYSVIWDSTAFDWSVITPKAFNTDIQAKRLTKAGEGKYRPAISATPVLRTVRKASHCTLEEMDVNNDGVIAENEPCVKFEQFVNSRFIDLYSPVPYVGDNEMDERMTTELFNCKQAQVREGAPDGASNCTDGALKGPGLKHEIDWRAQEGGIKLPTKTASASGTVAYQIANFREDSEDGQAKFMCKQVVNKSGLDLFIPPRTDEELTAFSNAVAKGSVPGVTIADCVRRFTAWRGVTTCPTLACGQTRTIAAERNCQRSTSALADCAECAKTSDPQPIAGFERKCAYSAVCVGRPCPRPQGGNGGGGGGGVGGGSDCLTGDAPILMADGSRKRIDQIKPGEKVMAFDRKAPLGRLYPATVSKVFHKPEDEVIKINDIRISPSHLLTVSQGRVTNVEMLRVGMKLVGLSGEPVTIHTVEVLPETVETYNLEIEGADGFVASDIRVLEEP